MTVAENNLFARLHRLALSQDENFLTESLAFLLQYLIANEPQSALSILRSITNQRLAINLDEIISVDIKTQVNTESGTPDITISTDNHLIYIEVKVDSVFGNNQLERYRTELIKSRIPNTSLIILTRYPYAEIINDTKIDYWFRWHNLSDWLANLNENVNNESSYFIINQFVGFLKIRGLSMDKVGWELIPGIEHFRTLIDMIGEALKAKGIHIYQRSAAWDYKGFYIENKKFFIGINLNYPNTIILNTEAPLIPNIDQDIKIGWLEAMPLT